jgi:hypothetical protein
MPRSAPIGYIDASLATTLATAEIYSKCFACLFSAGFSLLMGKTVLF